MPKSKRPLFDGSSAAAWSEFLKAETAPSEVSGVTRKKAKQVLSCVLASFASFDNANFDTLCALVERGVRWLLDSCRPDLEDFATIVSQLSARLSNSPYASPSQCSLLTTCLYGQLELQQHCNPRKVFTTSLTVLLEPLSKLSIAWGNGGTVRLAERLLADALFRSDTVETFESACTAFSVVVGTANKRNAQLVAHQRHLFTTLQEMLCSETRIAAAAHSMPFLLRSFVACLQEAPEEANSDSLVLRLGNKRRRTVGTSDGTVSGLNTKSSRAAFAFFFELLTLSTSSTSHHSLRAAGGLIRFATKLGIHVVLRDEKTRLQRLACLQKYFLDLLQACELRSTMGDGTADKSIGKISGSQRSEDSDDKIKCETKVNTPCSSIDIEVEVLSLLCDMDYQIIEQSLSRIYCYSLKLPVAQATTLLTHVFDTYMRLRQLGQALTPWFLVVAEAPKLASSVVGSRDFRSRLSALFARLPAAQITAIWDLLESEALIILTGHFRDSPLGSYGVAESTIAAGALEFLNGGSSRSINRSSTAQSGLRLQLLVNMFEDLMRSVHVSAHSAQLLRHHVCHSYTRVVHPPLARAVHAVSRQHECTNDKGQAAMNITELTARKAAEISTLATVFSPILQLFCVACELRRLCDIWHRLPSGSTTSCHTIAACSQRCLMMVQHENDCEPITFVQISEAVEWVCARRVTVFQQRKYSTSAIADDLILRRWLYKVALGRLRDLHPYVYRTNCTFTSEGGSVVSAGSAIADEIKQLANYVLANAFGERNGISEDTLALLCEHSSSLCPFANGSQIDALLRVVVMRAAQVMVVSLPREQYKRNTKSKTQEYETFHRSVLGNAGFYESSAIRRRAGAVFRNLIGEAVQKALHIPRAATEAGSLLCLKKRVQKLLRLALGGATAISTLSSCRSVLEKGCDLADAGKLHADFGALLRKEDLGAAPNDDDALLREARASDKVQRVCALLSLLASLPAEFITEEDARFTMFMLQALCLICCVLSRHPSQDTDSTCQRENAFSVKSTALACLVSATHAITELGRHQPVALASVLSPRIVVRVARQGGADGGFAEWLCKDDSGLLPIATRAWLGLSHFSLAVNITEKNKKRKRGESALLKSHVPPSLSPMSQLVRSILSEIYFDKAIGSNEIEYLSHLRRALLLLMPLLREVVDHAHIRGWGSGGGGEEQQSERPHEELVAAAKVFGDVERAFCKNLFCEGSDLMRLLLGDDGCGSDVLSNFEMASATDALLGCFSAVLEFRYEVASSSSKVAANAALLGDGAPSCLPIFRNTSILVVWAAKALLRNHSNLHHRGVLPGETALGSLKGAYLLLRAVCRTYRRLKPSMSDSAFTSLAALVITLQRTRVKELVVAETRQSENISCECHSVPNEREMNLALTKQQKSLLSDALRALFLNASGEQLPQLLRALRKEAMSPAGGVLDVEISTELRIAAAVRCIGDLIPILTRGVRRRETTKRSAPALLHSLLEAVARSARRKGRWSSVIACEALHAVAAILQKLGRGSDYGVTSAAVWESSEEVSIVVQGLSPLLPSVCHRGSSGATAANAVSCGLYAAVYEVMFALLKYRSSAVSACAPVFVGVIRAMQRCVVYTALPGNSCGDAKKVVAADQLARLCEETVNLKRVFRHHASALLAHHLELCQDPGVSSVVRRQFNLHAFFLLDCCSEFELQQLHSTSHSTSRQMLKDLNIIYEQEHKYDGKT